VLTSPEMNTTRNEKIPANENFIVAIGASAGGLEAIQDFFDNMPSNSNLSFIIIQHLSPDYKSLLVELISKHTHMKVYEAKHDMHVEPNCIYVIPNDKLLTIKEGRLQLNDKSGEKAPNTAIDTFLKSLAEDQQARAIAVILSGTGTDGTRGIQAIQRNGGMVFVQDPVSAKFDGMPNSAIATGFTDYILSPEMMPEEIFNYIKDQPAKSSLIGKPDENFLPEVLKLIEKSCQYDFTNYKTPTILRRISRRMGHLGIKSFKEYLEKLQGSSDECKILGKEFLIGVTKFFRDQQAFRILREEVIPQIIRSKEENDVLKVWVTACSSGEEAYSLAILIDDVLRHSKKNLEVKIFATDIDPDAIEFASKATYPAISVSELDESFLSRYFVKQGSHVLVNPRLRKQIVFARHNVLKDPPFIKNDLISCRNMLIYMNNVLQRKVLSTLQFSLNTGGFLFLGPSEIPSAVRENFDEVNGKWKIYRKVTSDNRYNPERLPSTQLYRIEKENRFVAVKENKKVTLNHVRVKEGGKERIINIYVKPAKEELILVTFSEGHETASKIITDISTHAPESISYISELEEELKETRANLQMAIESLETANEELQSSNEELLSANEELQSSNEELQSLNEELHTLNTEHQLRIKELIELNDDLNNYFRSTEIAQIFVDRNYRIRKFNPIAIQLINLIESDIGRPIDHISNNIKGFDINEEIKQVVRDRKKVEREVELQNGRISLMRILPYETKDKNVDGVVISFVDISRIKELDNIIRGVFNSSLNLIMALRAVRNERRDIVDYTWIASNHTTEQYLEKGKDEIIGKSVKQEWPQLLSNGLFEKLNKVVKTGKPLHLELQIEHGGKKDWFELVATQMMDGLVITLTDGNEKKKSEEKLRKNYSELMQTKENLRQLNTDLEDKVRERTGELTKSEERFRLIASATNDAVWDWDLVNNTVWWSDNFYKRFGYEKNQNVNRSDFWVNHIHPDDKEAVNKGIHEVINGRSQNWSAYYRFRKADGNYLKVHDRGTVLTDENGTPFRMVGAMVDVTDAEIAEQKLQEKNEALQAMIDEFKFVTDFMPQMVWATRPDGYHEFYNKQWYDYTGLAYDDTKGAGWNDVLHPDDQQRAWKVWNHCLQTGDPYEIEYRFKRYDGEYRWFLGRALPMRDEDGTIIKWFGTCTDIHDQKMLADVLEQKVRERTAELQRANVELESSNNELLQFASVASHDLKEPLRKIHMFSHLLKDKFADNNGAADYLERIISASARMTKLINDLLTFTRLSVSGTPESIDLNNIIEEVSSDLELAINEKSGKIDVGDLPKIEGVPGQLRQIFQNIISNALKFSRKDEAPHIKISSELIDSCSFDAKPSKKGEHCRVVIKDNGIGFDNQYAEKIFTIFQRLHSREKYDGTGIGLAITKKIIEKHNGIIKAESKEGEGATFTIILPLKQEELEPAS
jgi:two-component system, chemotaxis family, CheB/CheR fusion protein